MKAIFKGMYASGDVWNRERNYRSPKPAKIGIKIKTPNLDIYIITCSYEKRKMK